MTFPFFTKFFPYTPTTPTTLTTLATLSHPYSYIGSFPLLSLYYIMLKTIWQSLRIMGTLEMGNSEHERNNYTLHPG